MSEASSEPAVAMAPSAGRLLREAREKQGLHIAALAAAIKVSPKKLELLESDRFGELPDATFTRALAHTVCRALKTDPAAIMLLLPPPAGQRLEQLGNGLNAPFRERPGALVQRDWFHFAGNPVFWIVVLILVATAALYLLPASVTALALGRSPSAAVPAKHGGVEADMPPGTVEPGTSATTTTTTTLISVPMPTVPPSPPPRSVLVPASPGLGAAASATPTASVVAAVAFGPAASPLVVASGVASSPKSPAVAASAGGLPPGMLQLRASAASWVEITDGRGKPLVSRMVRPGEAIGVDGVPPFKVRIGNAAATQLVFRGQPAELHAFTRDNVARLELK